ncbi:hypothetical protein HYE54_01010 [Aggregatibacter actinomycetemcomitans]|uniref:hypothetical protein n=1 Tax=Aggregatibacter actinomycetemcomitans TaxID=714 RepID=UPI00197C4703|nr:hypothetical protein [Aggregatibacter actinomycetemcomitans]MBN6067398.1 hypothetical protein [Aggregatibacter actinomycetemcomitans]MBN6086100.1 hypothetical protein [Aggregatibacter actinomycetemcomitans]
MSYPFIDLKKATKEDLVNHLREHCGVEKDGKKEELVQAILDFESANGLIRQNEPTQTETNPQEAEPANLPLSAHKRVRIIVAPSENDSSDVYVSIGDWDALIKRGEEVSIPEPAYHLLAKSGELRLVQNKEGGQDEYFAPRFSITVLGDA